MDKRIWLVQWAFDIIHNWHSKVFEYAKQYCDYLIVALNTNELIATYKDSIPAQEWENKKEMLEAIRYVDKVIPATEFSPMNMLKDNDVDLFVCWDEWIDSHKEEIDYIEDKGWKVIISPRFEGCKSTTEIKQRIIDEFLRKNNLELKPKECQKE